MADATERESLQDGLHSPFWQWFQTHKEKEWGVGGARYEQAVKLAAEKQDADSVAMLRMVLFARNEIERLFQAPYERLNGLRHADRTDTALGASRRGPGL
jgi:hypothetical protein